MQFNVGPRLVYSDYWNTLLLSAQSDIFMMCGDDCVFRTPGWDTIVERAFAESTDKILLAYGDDTSPFGKTFATHPFIHRRWVEVVGYFSGPGFTGDFADSWVQDVADMIGRKKFLPIVTEHMHYYLQKAPDDETYQETRARVARDKMPELYAARLKEREADAQKLRDVLGTPWVKNVEA
ncbi:MAG TPA: hypothetical protein VND65_19235 [Candidatus Binatia bacterium]|nr:hypothetical protein [Candidatus Binatia bacterium]